LVSVNLVEDIGGLEVVETGEEELGKNKTQ
jgi:hypothetical protein